MAQQEIDLRFSDSRELVPMQYEFRKGVRYSLRLRGRQLQHLMVLNFAPRTHQVVTDLERQQKELHQKSATDPRQSPPIPPTTFFFNEIISPENSAKFNRLRQDLVQEELKI